MQDLEQTVTEMGQASADTHLLLNLEGRDPDEAATKLAYEKGYFLLRLVEETVGREKFDAFLREYFDKHAFQSMTTHDFVKELKEKLLSKAAGAETRIDIDKWISGPGIPPNAPKVKSDAFQKVEEQVRAFEKGTEAKKLDTKKWSTHEWIHFLRALPASLSAKQMAQLDDAFGFTKSGNSEILHEWLMRSVELKYDPAYAALEAFLLRQGRRKFLKPLFQKLAESDEGMTRARKIYEKARPTYHSVSRGTIDTILKW
jgi:hypothetical protein